MLQKYISKPNSHYSRNYSGTYQKPRICPHCGNGNDSITIDKTVLGMGEDAQALVETCKCTLCDRFYLFANYRDSSDGVGNATAAFYYPFHISSYQNEIISSFSERFIDMYNQALRAESFGDIELAAIGYRSALEILVKDFAKAVSGADPEEVAGKTLFSAIGDYLEPKELAAVADVVRILGNDYTHYERKYPRLDFELLKRYMEIFINLVETKCLIAHPPVSR